MDAVLQQVNGVIFPGGNDIIEPGSPYYVGARHVFDRVLAMNDAYVHFFVCLVLLDDRLEACGFDQLNTAHTHTAATTSPCTAHAWAWSSFPSW